MEWCRSDISKGNQNHLQKTMVWFPWSDVSWQNVILSSWKSLKFPLKAKAASTSYHDDEMWANVQSHVLIGWFLNGREPISRIINLPRRLRPLFTHQDVWKHQNRLHLGFSSSIYDSQMNFSWLHVPLQWSSESQSSEVHSLARQALRPPRGQGCTLGHFAASLLPNEPHQCLSRTTHCT